MKGFKGKNIYLICTFRLGVSAPRPFNYSTCWNKKRVNGSELHYTEKIVSCYNSPVNEVLPKEKPLRMEKYTMSVDEMAAAVGVSRPKAYELVNSEGFPVIRIGRRIRIPVAGLERWIEEQSSAQATSGSRQALRG